MCVPQCLDPSVDFQKRRKRWDMNSFGCLRNTFYRGMYLELLNSLFLVLLFKGCLSSFSALRSTQIADLVPDASVQHSESLFQSQRLNRRWGSTKGDIKETQDMASSISRQKDHSSSAAGKVLEQPGTRVCVEADLGWGHRALGVEKGLWNKMLWQSSRDASSQR